MCGEATSEGVELLCVRRPKTGRRLPRRGKRRGGRAHASKVVHIGGGGGALAKACTHAAQHGARDRVFGLARAAGEMAAPSFKRPPRAPQPSAGEAVFGRSAEALKNPPRGAGFSVVSAANATASRETAS